MSAPRTKRQFAGAASDPAQRQITSFFSKASPSSPLSDATTQTGARPDADAGLGSASLPATVQANLLSVGMRVRKSVPEGYKTGKVYGGFSLWQDPVSGAGSGSSGFSTHDSRPVFAIPASAVQESVPRELTPFCGIHKIGGLATQPGSDFTLPAASFAVAAGADFDDDQLAGPMSSQESVASTDSVSSASASLARLRHHHPLSTTHAATKKRRNEADEDGDGGADVPTVVRSGVWRTREDWLNGEVSPRSLAPSGWGNARVMAIPRRRTAKQAFEGDGSSDGVAKGTAALGLGDLGQENMVVDDFDEAPFLDSQWRDNMDIE
jgi:hypothetical protein